MQWLTDQSTNAKIVSNVNCESTSGVDPGFTRMRRAVDPATRALVDSYGAVSQDTAQCQVHDRCPFALRPCTSQWVMRRQGVMHPMRMMHPVRSRFVWNLSQADARTRTVLSSETFKLESDFWAQEVEADISVLFPGQDHLLRLCGVRSDRVECLEMGPSQT